jgi:CHAT domain-containing protein
LNTQVRAEKMRRQPDEAKLSDLETRLQKARNAYEVFQAAFYAAHPELKAKRGVFSEFTLEDAGAAIPDSGTAILEYVVTDEQAFLFVLTKKSASQANMRLDVHSINIKKSDLSDLVGKYRSLLSTNHPGFRQSGRELYDLLVKPAEPYLVGNTAVCIVPDGPPWNLPFQALQSDRDRYMLEPYAIYYAPSLQVLLEMRKRSNSLQSPPAGNDARKPRSLSFEACAGQLDAVGQCPDREQRRFLHTSR